MKQLMKRWAQRREQKGSIAFPVLLGAGAMFLGGLFFMADMPLKLIMSSEMVDTVNNAAASAVTQIVEEEVKHGRLVVDPIRAREAAYGVFARAYDLEITNGGTTLVAPDDGVLSRDPVVHVFVANKPLHSGNGWAQTIQLPDENGTEIEVRETSVVVYTEMNFKPFIRKNDAGMALTASAASEVAFPDYMHLPAEGE